MAVPRPGKAPEIRADAQAWLVSLACRKANALGYPHELWTTRLLARHAREHAVAGGHPCLSRIVQGTVCKILARHEVRPHMVRYYLERRDEGFEEKMADTLYVYREVTVLKADKADATNVAIISCDEKSGIGAIGNTTPDLPPKPGERATFARDHDDKRHGTLSLPTGIDLLTGKVHAGVENRQRSREFIGFLKRLNEAYPAETAIKLILDDYSARISKESNAWLATQPKDRFTFVFTPKSGSWRNLVKGFFSEMAWSLHYRIRVASKDDLNREPVIHAWTYKIDAAA